MKVVFLGTTGFHPNERRHTACVLLPESGVMFDAGTGMFRVPEYLTAHRLEIFLSHGHLDHVVGLTYLHDVERQRPLDTIRVHAHREILEELDRHLFSDTLFPSRPWFETHALEDGPVEIAGGEVSWFDLEHPGGSTGYRIDWPDRSIAYVTDTTAQTDSSYIEQIAGVDLLLHECNMKDELAEWATKVGHSHTSAVAEVARQAKVGRLVLLHFNALSTEDDPVGLDVARSIFPNTELADDRRELEF